MKMFVLTRRMLVYGLVTLIVFPAMVFVVFATDLKTQPAAFFGVFAGVMIVLFGLREVLMRGEDQRHHRASLEFSYSLIAAVVIVPALYFIDDSFSAETESSLRVLIPIMLIILAMMYVKARRSLKGYTPAKIFEAESSPRWTQRWPLNAPFSALCVYATLATVMFITTGLLLANVVTDGFGRLDFILTAMTIVVLLVLPFPAMGHERSRTISKLPYLYSGVNIVLLIIGQLVFFRGTPIGDLNHWSAFAYFWIILLSLTLPFVYHKRSIWANTFDG
jgi:hypothetical protein